VTTAAQALNSGSPTKLRAAQRDLAQATTAFGTTLNETIDRINKTLN
jgi:ABC-type transporter Mla subunit MlaD